MSPPALPCPVPLKLLCRLGRSLPPTSTRFRYDSHGSILKQRSVLTRHRQWLRQLQPPWAFWTVLRYFIFNFTDLYELHEKFCVSSVEIMHLHLWIFARKRSGFNHQKLLTNIHWLLRVSSFLSRGINPQETETLPNDINVQQWAFQRLVTCTNFVPKSRRICFLNISNLRFQKCKFKKSINWHFKNSAKKITSAVSRSSHFHAWHTRADVVSPML